MIGVLGAAGRGVIAQSGPDEGPSREDKKTNNRIESMRYSVHFRILRLPSHRVDDLLQLDLVQYLEAPLCDLELRSGR